MAKSVEEKLMQMLGEARGGTAEVEGAKELKLLKERNVSRLSSSAGLWLICSASCRMFGVRNSHMHWSQQSHHLNPSIPFFATAHHRLASSLARAADGKRLRPFCSG